MSATNKALLNITKQDANVDGKKSISLAHVPNMESKFKASFFFSIGVISSLCIIGWATLNNTASTMVIEHPIEQGIQINSAPSSSPTKKVTTQEISRIYAEQKSETLQSEHINDNQINQQATATAKVNNARLANVDAKSNDQGQLQVEEVELLPSELAQKSRDSAEVALGNANFKEAIKDYYTVLKYQPRDENSRKKLAALLYGKRDIQESAAILQQGIRLNKDSVDLRLALASLLQKEDQPEAALSTLEYIPLGVSVDYLATRGGLAQKLKLMDLAEESYQMLVTKDPENGRWWLGIAIVYERNAQVKDALKTYKIALMTPGLSRSSQVFVRDRIKLLETMEGNE
ncbi:tetratricopeptide repeat protein [uncultured Aliivibrio sp.]|uniref:tetratricopeptide repeat protein n=1 Tax=uncultured Aliivibrio sp. TaxID=873085 RepID=UPI00260310F7|nr:tetratricopeptide repeat protein [uncultured Aliivibrio sp.]